MKGDIGIKFDKLKEIYLNLEPGKDELSNYYNDFFKLKLASKTEPILLTGPSSYKTYLAKYYIKSNSTNLNRINLNQKTTIEELLGGPRFLSYNSSKNFYLDKLLTILNLREPITNESIKDKIQKTKNDEAIIESETKKYSSPTLAEIDAKLNELAITGGFGITGDDAASCELTEIEEITDDEVAE